MNRHPYGGYDGPAPRRRSASPPFRGGGGGAGGYRGGRGGRAPRGRGGYAGNGDPSYDPYQSQDPYKSQDPYNPPPPAPYATPASINGDFSNSYGAVPPPRDPYFTAAPTGPSQYEGARGLNFEFVESASEFRPLSLDRNLGQLYSDRPKDY